MERRVYNNLVAWKEDSNRKPLLLEGARQVGKTWLLKEFARRQYENYVYLNFDEESDLKSIFESTKNPSRLIELISITKGCHIEKGTSLIIFDEVQECPEALNSLKYFKEEENEYHIAAAGSLLGVFLSESSVPVGMLDIIKVYPLDFAEFLLATEPNLYEYYISKKEERVVKMVVFPNLLGLVKRSVVAESRIISLMILVLSM